jgi:YD repeat-containing protein
MNNRMTKMVDAVGTTIYTYTDFGALQSEDGPWNADTVSYTHTTNQLRSGLSLLQPNASPWAQSYGYDDSDRLTGITSPAGAFAYQYHSTSRLHVARLGLPSGSYITNTFDGLSRLTGTYLKNSQGGLLNAHQYLYDPANRQTRADGSFVDYGYDAIGQLTSSAAKESGGTTNRLHEQFGYAYDAAWNLNHRTNNALLQTFNVDNQNQLTTQTRSGTLTVAGTTTSAATNVTVNGATASRYADHTFAKDGVSLTEGTNTFTAIAQDSYGRQDSNTVSVYLPASVTFVYDGNGNLRTNGTRILDYDDENQLIRITEPGAWLSEFVYDGKMRRRLRREYVWQTDHWTLNTEVHYVYDGMLVLQERHYNPQLSTLKRPSPTPGAGT